MSRSSPIKFSDVCLPAGSADSVARVVNTGWLSQGPEVRKLEQLFSDRSAQYSLACSSGTTALHLALEALEISSGDVLVPALSYVATANAVLYAGLSPVFIDVDPISRCMSPSAMRAAVTDDVKAVILVDLNGRVGQNIECAAIAKRMGLHVIDDAAQALFSGRAGTYADISCYSLHGSKIVTAGEGGVITTPDKNLHERIELLRGQGQVKNKRYIHDRLAYNYRMTEMQAAIAQKSFSTLDRSIDVHLRLGEKYCETLSLQRDLTDGEYDWKYAVSVPHLTRAQRDAIVDDMADVVETRPMFYPLPEMSHLRGYPNDGYVVSSTISSMTLFLPLHVNLTDEDVLSVCEALTRSIEKCT